MEIAVLLAVAGDVFDGVFVCCPFFPRDVLEEIWDLIESVFEGFPVFSSFNRNKRDNGQVRGIIHQMFYRILSKVIFTLILNNILNFRTLAQVIL